MTNKFTALHSQTIYPSRFDNQKKWIKYYEQYTRNRRKSRLSRASMTLMDQSMLKSTIGYPINNFGFRDLRGSLVNNNIAASFIANNNHQV